MHKGSEPGTLISYPHSRGTSIQPSCRGREGGKLRVEILGDGELGTCHIEPFDVVATNHQRKHTPGRREDRLAVIVVDGDRAADASASHETRLLRGWCRQRDVLRVPAPSKADGGVTPRLRENQISRRIRLAVADRQGLPGSGGLDKNLTRF